MRASQLSHLLMLYFPDGLYFLPIISLSISDFGAVGYGELGAYRY